MSTLDTSRAPYYDDFDPDKQYYRVMAVPGRVAQAREITQSQTIMLEALKNIGNVFLRNGSVVEGCQVIVHEDRTKITVTEGRVYLEGTILPVHPTTLDITGVGVERVGVKLVETVITEIEDPTLRDPAQGYDNFDQPGAHRLKRSTQVVVEDPESAIISTLVEGVPVVDNIRPEYDILEQTLARRTFDESGSYIVEGLKIRIEPLNNEHINIIVERGKAYVLGFELRKPFPVRMPNPRARETKTIEVPNITYNTSVAMYQLESRPFVRDINNIRGVVQTTQIGTIMSNTDSTLLDEHDVVSLQSVTQGATTFTIGAGPGDGHCYLKREGSRYYVQWNGGTAPTPGNSYNIVYRYTRTFVKDIDYKLTLSNRSHFVEWLSGAKPLNGSTFSVSYQLYLARRDLVYLDQFGNVHVAQGSSAELGFEQAPSVPVNTLLLAQISNPPNGAAYDDPGAEDVIIDNVGLTRYTMKDIYELVERVKRSEYNQAQLALNDDARNRNTLTSKKGIITDPVVDFSKVDIHYNRSVDGDAIDPSKPLYDVAFNFTLNEVTLPTDIWLSQLVVEDSTSSYRHSERLGMLPYTATSSLLSQPVATRSFLVNPYTVYPGVPEISIDPSIDTWIEDTVIMIPVSLTSNVVVEVQSRWVTGSAGVGVQDEVIGTQTSTRSYINLVEERAVTYIRPRTINVIGKKYAPNLDRITCYFDGKKVDLTPVSGTVAGSQAGTVRSNDSGEFRARFTIPSGVLTGVREVTLESPIQISGYINSSTTIYQATGIERVWHQTIETTTTVLLRRTVTNRVLNVDPVAQTFTLERMSFLDSVDVYFEAKPTTPSPITLEIRDVVSGVPGREILGQCTLSTADVNISPTGAVATRFVLDDPVILQAGTEYCFVLLTPSNLYRVWVAELGGRDVATGNTVIKNSYLTGVMLSSSNASTWTSHQTMDIKFILRRPNFATTGTIEFEEMTVPQASMMQLQVEQLIPQGCDSRWYYQVEGTGVWQPLTPGSLKTLTQTFTEVKIKVVMTRQSDVHLSPLLALDSMDLVTYTYSSPGHYIGANISGIDSYSSVDIILDTLLPSGGTGIAVKVSGNNNTWVDAVLDNTQTKLLDNGWREHVYKVSLTPSTQFRVRVDMSTSDLTVSPKFRKLRCIMS